MAAPLAPPLPIFAVQILVSVAALTAGVQAPRSASPSRPLKVACRKPGLRPEPMANPVLRRPVITLLPVFVQPVAKGPARVLNASLVLVRCRYERKRPT